MKEEFDKKKQFNPNFHQNAYRKNYWKEISVIIIRNIFYSFSKWKTYRQEEILFGIWRVGFVGGVFWLSSLLSRTWRFCSDAPFSKLSNAVGEKAVSIPCLKKESTLPPTGEFPRGFQYHPNAQENEQTQSGVLKSWRMVSFLQPYSRKFS